MKKMVKGNEVAQHHAFELCAQLPVTALASTSPAGAAVAMPAIVKAARMFFRSMVNVGGAVLVSYNRLLMKDLLVKSSVDFSMFK